MKRTIQDMISIGEIPIHIKMGLENFGFSALQSLLPLRIGRINPNTGEDENDYTLIHKCIERGQITDDQFVYFSDLVITNHKVQTINDNSFGRPIEKNYYLCWRVGIGNYSRRGKTICCGVN